MLTPLLAIYPGEMKTYICKSQHTMFSQSSHSHLKVGITHMSFNKDNLRHFAAIQ